ncbi:hypothetical protein [Acanthamoeba polyphaga mimivirus]|nr:hypothetical protein [Acanthamoeba castellanii mamavirus]UMZ08416.1 hypothetical protein [Acanthamoeba polyphaga mimivirus]
MRRNTGSTITGYKAVKCFYGATNIIELRATINVDSDDTSPIFNYETGKHSQSTFNGTDVLVTKIKTLAGQKLPDSFFREFNCMTYDFGFDKIYPGSKIEYTRKFYYDKNDSDMDKKTVPISISNTDIIILSSENLYSIKEKYNQLADEYDSEYFGYILSQHRLEDFSECYRNMDKISDRNNNEDKWIFQTVKENCHDKYYQELDKLLEKERMFINLLNNKSQLGNFILEHENSINTKN